MIITRIHWPILIFPTLDWLLLLSGLLDFSNFLIKSNGILFLFEFLKQSLQRQDNNSDIIQRLLLHSGLQKITGSPTTKLVDTGKLFIPHRFNGDYLLNLLVLQFIENPIATQNKIQVTLLDWELRDLGNSDHYSFDPLILRQLRFHVPERTRHW